MIYLVISILATVVGVTLFARGLWKMWKLVVSGAPEEGRWSHPWQRLWTTVRVTLTHSTFKGRPVVRVAHWLVMVGFVTLIFTLGVAYIQVVNPSFDGVPQWLDWFAFGMAALTFVAIVTLTLIRLATPKGRRSRFFGSSRWQAWFVEAVITTVAVCVMLGQFVPGTQWIPTLKIVTSMLWMSVVGLDIGMGISWHRFLAPINIAAARSPKGTKPLGALPLPLVDGKPTNNLEEAFDTVEDPSIGLGSVEDMTWKTRLDALACTECGRCQDMCPAWNTDKPLSPKLLMLSLRDNAVFTSGDNPPWQENADPGDVLGALMEAQGEGTQIGGQMIPDDVLWSCTMCGACVDQCPVDIEHVDHIANLRRYQVVMESAFPRELAKPFRAMETKGNPYNQMPRKRLEWAKNLDFEVPVIEEDAGDYEYLFWVGCAGAYDDNAKKTSAAVAELLHTAGVSFGVLGSAETCSGDPARRAGNEVLFQMLANQAIETLNEVKAKKIVATCAHCFNTLANEYPDFGGHFEVIHHTELLNRLVKEGLLTPAPGTMGEITYQDPCFLGRYNRVFEAPRELLGSVGELVEMEQSGEVSMCCGAGGARAWMEEDLGTRISVARMDQAEATGASTLATACPFCTQMLDGSGDVEVKEVSVLLLDGVRQGQEGNRPHQ